MTDTKKEKWTLMFFFAGDNTLSPSMLSQIKAIKAAGYQQDTNVLVHFDPNERGAPTRIFEVNRNENKTRIGECEKRLSSVLSGDDITATVIDQLSRGEKVAEIKAEDALTRFLEFCRNSYPAQHYMLFLVGHGMIVGHDDFLWDENPRSAIGLGKLGQILKGFSDNISGQGVLELIGMHSCSMSAVEVAYQLQGTAGYMMASEGISFVGAWPYRQMLIKIFKAIESAPVDMLQLVDGLHDLCIRHSTDFMVGGYSADLGLCTLDSTNVTNLDEPIKVLAGTLSGVLADQRRRGLILLAHWNSQSYWQETYTDLYDFCLCLRDLCLPTDGTIKDACQGVIDKLEPSPRTRDGGPTQPSPDSGPVIRTDFVGSGYQYSHGLSIYFPWSQPIKDTTDPIGNYAEYKFATNSATSAWLAFLRDYFRETQRPSRVKEDRAFDDPEFQDALSDAQEAFRIPGAIGPISVPSTSLDGKVTPPDSGGGACSCPSIKNHEIDFVMSFGAAGVFRKRRDTKPATAAATTS